MVRRPVVSDNDGGILLDLADGAHAHLAILLEAGADVNKRSMSGSTPLIATCAGAAGMVSLLPLICCCGQVRCLSDSHGRRPMQLLEAVKSPSC